MAPILQMQELVVVVLAQNNNPTILNPDFLKVNGIVPDDWPLQKNPICTDPFAQVVYKNGISFVSQLDRLIIREPAPADDNFVAPDLMTKYLKTLPHVNYLAVGTNPKGKIKVETPEQSWSRIRDELVFNGPWKDFKGMTPWVSMKFRYFLPDTCLLSITVGAETRHGLAGPPTKYIEIDSNFHRDLGNVSGTERLEALLSVISNYQKDIETLREWVELTFARRP